ncbi:uncharacterized protein At1g32220, chloroplastic-like [Rhodamnia argentea]|uniref:Uncharacterized protein At1g32220, chloroplastic-like n=1 Tax=Rhodamnia argentea TaxID=178133 RepID=A0ABM3H9T3_9MYRT|nr:uncharacterized protein At1g32220, chloroplastic-like [Rhodamnia argentea]
MDSPSPDRASPSPSSAFPVRSQQPKQLHHHLTALPLAGCRHLSVAEASSDVPLCFGVSELHAFGSNSHMYKIDGTANINAIRASSEQGVKRFVYISATDFVIANYLLRGYYEGKALSLKELLTKFPYGEVILRPGFIYGIGQVESMKIPLGVIGSPLEMIFQHAKPLNQVPLVGPLFTPPVNVTAVAKVAVRVATDPVFLPGIVDVHGILRYSQQKMK